MSSQLLDTSISHLLVIHGDDFYDEVYTFHRNDKVTCLYWKYTGAVSFLIQILENNQLTYQEIIRNLEHILGTSNLDIFIPKERLKAFLQFIFLS